MTSESQHRRKSSAFLTGLGTPNTSVSYGSLNGDDSILEFEDAIESRPASQQSNKSLRTSTIQKNILDEEQEVASIIESIEQEMNDSDVVVFSSMDASIVADEHDTIEDAFSDASYLLDENPIEQQFAEYEQMKEQLSQQLNAMESNYSSTAAELQDFLHAVKDKVMEDGEKLVEFPADYEQIVDVMVDMRKSNVMDNVLFGNLTFVSKRNNSSNQ